MLKKQPPLLVERGLISTAVLDSIRAYSKVFHSGESIGDHCTEWLIRCAITEGHADGHPMTASDLADYLGIARGTVVRKLVAPSFAHGVVTETRGRRREF